jgi:hypothetical protein
MLLDRLPNLCHRFRQVDKLFPRNNIRREEELREEELLMEEELEFRRQASE